VKRSSDGKTVCGNLLVAPHIVSIYSPKYMGFTLRMENMRRQATKCSRCHITAPENSMHIPRMRIQRRAALKHVVQTRLRRSTATMRRKRMTCIINVETIKQR